MMQRTFQIEHEWCMIHYPEKPNGFAVMIFGDVQHFVDEAQSFWTQNIGRKKMIQELTDSGYIVFYSNYGGRHWGSERAVELAHTLYHIVMKQEILNDKIHVLAEGMGAAAVPRLLNVMDHKIRSVVFIAPCLSLKSHVEQEQEKKFYYKKLVSELSSSYQVDKSLVMDKIIQHEQETKVLHDTHCPLSIISLVERSRYESQQEYIKCLYHFRLERKLPITIQYLLPEKRVLMTRKVLKLLQMNEADL
ncbi:alpha/beta hydrolase family protein [Falsibacillus albus]|uniref:Hydrolase n=1 Tax=Falsibacillus albus TaxID=2478915 RepID=A0A3L7K282_9BACI|nr:hydrolase [Falsibacillus albus]RLQ97207.1 hydrolase [Falsibacillus albus]